MTDNWTPPGRAFDPVGPPPAGLVTAFTAARRRRNRSAALSGSAGVVASVLLLALVGGASPQVLVQQPAPPASQVVGGPQRVHQDAGLAAIGATGPAGTAVAPATTGQSPSGLRTTAPVASASPPAAVHGRQPGRFPHNAMTSGVGYQVPYGTQPTCPVNGTPGLHGTLCGQAWVVTNGSSVRLGVEVCNVGSDVATMSFPTALEADVVVRAPGGTKELWRWSAGQTFPARPRTQVLQVGDCGIWETVWDEVDQAGRRLPPGTYQMTARSAAEELRGTSYTSAVTVN